MVQNVTKTLKYNTLIVALNLADRICNIAVHCDDERLAKKVGRDSWCRLMKAIAANSVEQPFEVEKLIKEYNVACEKLSIIIEEK